jgi:hypothetical protein
VRLQQQVQPLNIVHTVHLHFTARAGHLGPGRASRQRVDEF